MRQMVQDFEGLESSVKRLKENLDSVKCTSSRVVVCEPDIWSYLTRVHVKPADAETWRELGFKDPVYIVSSLPQ